MQPIVTKVSLIQGYFVRFAPHLEKLSAEQGAALRQQLSRLPLDELANENRVIEIIEQQLGAPLERDRVIQRSPAAGEKKAHESNKRSPQPAAAPHVKTREQRSAAPGPSKQHDPLASLRKKVQAVMKESVNSFSAPEPFLYQLPHAGQLRIDMTKVGLIGTKQSDLTQSIMDAMVPLLGDKEGASQLKKAEELVGKALAEGFERTQEYRPHLVETLDRYFARTALFYKEGEADLLSRIALYVTWLQRVQPLLAQLAASSPEQQEPLWRTLKESLDDPQNLKEALIQSAGDQEYFYREIAKFEDLADLLPLAPLLIVDPESSTLLMVNRDAAFTRFYAARRAELLDLFADIVKATDLETPLLANDERLLHFVERLHGTLREEVTARIALGGEHLNRKAISSIRKIIHNAFHQREQTLERFFKKLEQYLTHRAGARQEPVKKQSLPIKEEHRSFHLNIAAPMFGQTFAHHLQIDIETFNPEQSYGNYCAEVLAQEEAGERLSSVVHWTELMRTRYYESKKQELESGYTTLVSGFWDQLQALRSSGGALSGHLVAKLPEQIQAKAGSKNGPQLYDLTTSTAALIREYLKRLVQDMATTGRLNASLSLESIEVSPKLRITADLKYEYMSEHHPLLQVPVRLIIAHTESVSFDQRRPADLTLQKVNRMMTLFGQILRSDKSGNLLNLVNMVGSKTVDYFETDRFMAEVVQKYRSERKDHREALFTYKAGYDSKYVVLEQDHAVHRKFQRMLDQLKTESVSRNYADYLEVSSRAREYQREIIFFMGPTNSGKSYEAFNLLVEGENGIYLAPLRLLALEGKEEIVKRGKPCNLVTGEEEELMEGATFSAQTIETIDLDAHYEVAVIDEIQMMEDSSRGWAWTQALAGLNARKLILTGSGNALPIVTAIANKLKDSLKVVEKERKNPLVWTQKAFHKNMKLKEGTAVIAFTRKKILEIRDELVSRNNKVAVVYGALSPETRRLEAQHFRSGEATILVSTDAIGMGLNLPISQVLFAQSSKFDGVVRRELAPSEVIQIGGRAGRYGLKDREEGVVGYITGFCPHLEPEVLRDGFNQAAAGLENVKCGYVVPSYAQVCEAREIFYDKPLSKILKIIATNLEFSEDWAVLCHEKMEDMIQKTKLLEDHFAHPNNDLLAKLAFTKVWKLISAPCDLDTLQDTFVNYCSAVIAGTEPLYPDLPSLPITKASLARAEFAIKQLTIYSWFARRFRNHIPATVDKDRDPAKYLAIQENGIFEPVERTDEDREILSHAISKAMRDERRLAPSFQPNIRW
jgi:hypothetical protein